MDQDGNLIRSPRLTWSDTSLKSAAHRKILKVGKRSALRKARSIQNSNAGTENGTSGKSDITSHGSTSLVRWKSWRNSKEHGRDSEKRPKATLANVTGAQIVQIPAS